MTKPKSATNQPNFEAVLAGYAKRITALEKQLMRSGSPLKRENLKGQVKAVKKCYSELRAALTSY